MAAARVGGVKDVAPWIESALALSTSRGVFVKSVIWDRISWGSLANHITRRRSNGAAEPSGCGTVASAHISLNAAEALCSPIGILNMSTSLFARSSGVGVHSLIISGFSSSYVITFWPLEASQGDI